MGSVSLPMGGRHEAKDTAAVGRLPPKKLMWKIGGVIPGEFEGGEGFDAALAEELRKLPAEAEGVGEPGDFADFAELFLAVALSVEDLASDGFSADDVEFGFYPKSGVYAPATCFDFVLNLRKQFGAVVF